MTQPSQAGKPSLVSGAAEGEEGGEDFGDIVAIVRAHRQCRNLEPTSVGLANSCGARTEKISSGLALLFSCIFIVKTNKRFYGAQSARAKKRLLLTTMIV